MTALLAAADEDHAPSKAIVSELTTTYAKLKTAPSGTG